MKNYSTVIVTYNLTIITCNLNKIKEKKTTFCVTNNSIVTVYILTIITSNLNKIRRNKNVFCVTNYSTVIVYMIANTKYKSTFWHVYASCSQIQIHNNKKLRYYFIMLMHAVEKHLLYLSRFACILHFTLVLYQYLTWGI